MAEVYDLVVVGSGSAGVAAALEARSRGARVMVVEAGALGGTCVNVGCVPSKTLLRAGEAARRAKKASFPGIEPKGVRVSFSAVAAARDELIQTLRKEKYEDVLHAAGVRLRRGKGALPRRGHAGGGRGKDHGAGLPDRHRGRGLPAAGPGAQSRRGLDLQGGHHRHRAPTAPGGDRGRGGGA